MLWRVLWTLSKVETAAGYEAGADPYRDQIRANITYFADHIGRKLLHAAFLALPQV